ncbi:MAG: RusA family crossover junction endodeoxyribonuclease [Vagococcus sp.]|uniref:RusA family crossover junction endodeoxyribonuclease n=1 Tax=Lactobacillales TaxID=186826 RepID=UPI002FC6BAE3
MANRIVIPLPLMTLNEYTNEQRRNRFGGASAKKKQTAICEFYVKQAMRDGVTFEIPTRLKFNWYMPNKKQDPDNIAFQKKFVLDGMIKAKFLENDGWKQILGFSDYFEVDKENPRVEIEVE